MGAHWPIRTIADCASDEPYSTQIGPFGKALMAEEYADSGVPVLRGVNVNRGRFHDDDFVFIDSATADRLGKFESFPGDVLLVHKGTLGQIGLMPSRRKYSRYIMGNSMMRVRCNPEKLLPEYLYYWLTSADGQHYLFSRVSQVGVPQIQTPLTTLRQAALPVPPIPEQRSIVRILGTLDDKIELNRRMNETLEAMAQALFKSWFADFDPVRAKVEGRDPGVPEHLAALFPERLIESEVGEIPQGWDIRGLGECLSLLKDGSHNPPKRVQEGVRFIAGATDIKHFSVDFAKCTYISEDDYSVMHRKWNVLAGDVLLTIVGTVGNVALVVQSDLPFSFQRSIAILRSGPTLSSSYLYCFLNSAPFKAAVKSRLNPTAQPGIYLGTLGAIPICVPAPRVLRAFDRIASALFARMQNAVQQTRDVTSLRDTLLPKLISGELRVREAERVVEQVA